MTVRKTRQDTLTEVVDASILTEVCDLNAITDGVEENTFTAVDDDKCLIRINSLNEFDLDDIFSGKKKKAAQCAWTPGRFLSTAAC